MPLTVQGPPGACGASHVVIVTRLRGRTPLATAVLLVMASSLAPGQLISVGVTGGIPISPYSKDYGQGCLISRRATGSATQTICGSNRFFAKPYAVGPILALHFPRRVSVEAGMLYERFHQDVSHGLVVSRGGANFGQYFGASANGWLFPLQLKYVFGEGRLSPFVNAGATLRHLGPFDGAGIQVDPFLQPQPASFHIESGRDLDVAETVGAGVRWRAGIVDVSPEIRFLHWTSAYYQPAQNQIMLMVGITFPNWR